MRQRDLLGMTKHLRLDLENLLRMVAHEPERGSDIVEHFLDQMFLGEHIEMSDASFDQVKARIMPRVQPISIFEHLSEELVAHVPFVNDTVIVFVMDMPHMTVSITTEQLVRWGVTIDDLEECRRVRDESEVTAALDAVEAAARSTDNTMPAILRAIERLATVGQICDRLERVFGRYRPSRAF